MVNKCAVASMARTLLVADGAGAQTMTVVPSVELDRYMGTWYEIARLPNRFQKQCAGEVSATYSLLADGTVKVVNRCRKENGEFAEAEGQAKRTDEEEPNTKLKVRFAPAFLSFLPFVWGDYWIIYLTPDYTCAVIGEPSREYLWVLSRTPTMEPDALQAALESAKQQGYDLAELVMTRQE